MGALIVLEQIVEEEGPVVEEEAVAAGEAISAEAQALAQAAEKEAPVIEDAVISAGKTVVSEAEVLAQEVESAGKAALDKLSNAFTSDNIGNAVSKCTQAVSNTGKSVWDLNPFQRGREIEQAIGTNLPSNFPTIDRFENGVATSIKSLDLEAPTYQSVSTLSRTLTNYIDKVADFAGR